ncbi:MAG: DUF4157 domain-containing protein, partial [Pyrinomonadaceae bacterium]|nr:DUF4157 domain-containing protein [Pyrinomonadaceae bacterium]
APPQRGILQRKCACGTHTVAGGECAACEKEKASGLLQRSATSAGAVNEVPSIVHEVLRSQGRPLDSETRAFMESRFDHDFSQVRVHTDAKAAESARAVNARAYTVGTNVVFGAGQYNRGGRRLLAHELAHVVQQSEGVAGVQPSAITESDHPTEREADAAAQAVLNGQRPRVALKSTGTMLHRDKDDLVAYSGGQSGTITVVQAKKIIFTSSSVSGHPGHGVDEPGEGPIPDGSYKMHPEVTQPTVSKLQGGVCGANAIGKGYQEITSTDPSPCSGAHYCNVPCPTTANPKQMCFTPQDCWGPKRIKIEGSAMVKGAGGKMVKRDGFYLHGGNPKDAVSSGCVKALSNDVFDEIRKLKGEVEFCVGTGCPAWLATLQAGAAAAALKNAAFGAVKAAERGLRSVGSVFGL